jgi:hypothetical protein
MLNTLFGSGEVAPAFKHNAMPVTHIVSDEVKFNDLAAVPRTARSDTPHHLALVAKPRNRTGGTVTRAQVGKTKKMKKPQKAHKPRSLTQRIGDISLRDTADFASSVFRAGAYISTAVFNVEEKMLDIVLAATNITSSANISCLTLIAQGNDYNNRNGLSIRVRNICLTVSAVANTTAKVNFLRIIVLQDWENQGVAPTMADLLESTGADQYLSHYNHVLGNRFQVLLDEHVVLVDTSNAYFQRFTMPSGCDILFKTSAATTAAQYNGTIYCICLSDNATNGPLVAWDSRVTFVDN